MIICTGYFWRWNKPCKSRINTFWYLFIYLVCCSLICSLLFLNLYLWEKHAHSYPLSLCPFAVLLSCLYGMSCEVVMTFSLLEFCKIPVMPVIYIQKCLQTLHSDTGNFGFLYSESQILALLYFLLLSLLLTFTITLFLL